MEGPWLNAGVALAVAVSGCALALAGVSFVSWRRIRRAKLLVVGGAFLVLAAKGALAAWRAVDAREVDFAGLSLDAAVLGFLYASVAMR